MPRRGWALVAGMVAVLGLMLGVRAGLGLGPAASLAWCRSLHPVACVPSLAAAEGAGAEAADARCAWSVYLHVTPDSGASATRVPVLMAFPQPGGHARGFTYAGSSADSRGYDALLQGSAPWPLEVEGGGDVPLPTWQPATLRLGEAAWRARLYPLPGAALRCGSVWVQQVTPAWDAVGSGGGGGMGKLVVSVVRGVGVCVGVRDKSASLADVCEATLDHATRAAAVVLPQSMGWAPRGGAWVGAVALWVASGGLAGAPPWAEARCVPARPHDSTVWSVVLAPPAQVAFFAPGFEGAPGRRPPCDPWRQVVSGGRRWDHELSAGAAEGPAPGTTAPPQLLHGVPTCVSVRALGLAATILLMHRQLGTARHAPGAFPAALVAALAFEAPPCIALRLVASLAVRLRLWCRGGDAEVYRREDLVVLASGAVAAASTCPNVTGDVLTLGLAFYLAVLGAAQLPTVVRAAAAREGWSVALRLLDAVVYPAAVGVTRALPALDAVLPGAMHNADVVLAFLWVVAPLAVGLPHRSALELRKDAAFPSSRGGTAARRAATP